MPLQPHTPLWNLGPQSLDWVSPSRDMPTTAALFDSQPNYEHEVVRALDTGIKYQGIAPVIGGWAYATGLPVLMPLVPAVVNDQFTHLLLEFDGKEGSTTYVDANFRGIPRPWTQLTGFGHITTAGEKFPPGALLLTGETVITAPDSVAFDLAADDFTFRGWFLCDFPLGEQRILVSKSDRINQFSFWLMRMPTGEFSAGVITFTGELDNTIVTRPEDVIVDRNGNPIHTRFANSIGSKYEVHSLTQYSDTLNTGWHSFKFTRNGTMLDLVMDGSLEDTSDMGTDPVRLVPGPITIGGFGPPIDGFFHGTPWRGGLDRFAVDIGIGRA